MQRLAVLTLILAVVYAHADKPQVTVWTKGSIPAARALFAPNSGVKILGAEEERERNRESGLLTIEQRDSIFRKAGMFEKIDRQMDEFDKDMLAMALRDYTLQELSEDYPMFTKRELASLKTELEKVK